MRQRGRALVGRALGLAPVARGLGTHRLRRPNTSMRLKARRAARVLRAHRLRGRRPGIRRRHRRRSRGRRRRAAWVPRTSRWRGRGASVPRCRHGVKTLARLPDAWPHRLADRAFDQPQGSVRPTASFASVARGVGAHCLRRPNTSLRMKERRAARVPRAHCLRWRRTARRRRRRRRRGCAARVPRTSCWRGRAASVTRRRRCVQTFARLPDILPRRRSCLAPPWGCPLRRHPHRQRSLLGCTTRHSALCSTTGRSGARAAVGRHLTSWTSSSLAWLRSHLPQHSGRGFILWTCSKAFPASAARRKRWSVGCARSTRIPATTASWARPCQQRAPGARLKFFRTQHGRPPAPLRRFAL